MLNLYRYTSILLIAFFLTACGSPQPAEAATKAMSISFLLSQVRTTAGPLAGGRVDFYAAGTTTRKTIWLDRNKATPAANPYTLDSNGTAQLYGDGLYRIVIKDSAGVTKYDRDYISIRDISGNVYDVADYAGLAEAVASIGNTPVTLQFASDVTVSANLVIPATLELMPLNGAKINHSTYTIAYSGPVDRWPQVQIFNGTGAVTVTGDFNPIWSGTKYNAGALVEPSGVFTSGIGAGGVTKSVLGTESSRFRVPKSSDLGVPAGIYANYSTVTATVPEQQNVDSLIVEVTAHDTTTSRTQVGQNILANVHVDAPGNFAWHNRQSYVESDAANPTEIAGDYVAVDCPNGASPFGSIINAYASGATKYNNLYGIELTTVDNVGGAAANASKGISMRHLGNFSMDYGHVIFGRGGYAKALSINNRGDRSTAESLAAGDYGGGMDYAVHIEGEVYKEANFSVGSTHTLVAGDVIEGVTSGATAVYKGMAVISGSLAGGDAQGRLYVTSSSAPFTSAERVKKQGGAQFANISGDFTAPVIANGVYVKNVTNPVTVKNAADATIFSVSGTGAVSASATVYPTQNILNNTDASQSVAAGTFWSTTEDATGKNITALTGGTNGKVIVIEGRGGVSPSVLVDSSSIRMSGNWTAAAYATIQLIFDAAGNCWVELSRSAN